MKILLLACLAAAAVMACIGLYGALASGKQLIVPGWARISLVIAAVLLSIPMIVSMFCQ